MSAAEPVSVPVKDPSGNDVGNRELPTAAVDTRIRYRLLKDSAVMYLANQRRGTHKTKSRSEVAGATSKPWRQKGTGRARAGSRKSPVWRGGGVAFGPRPRDYSYSINRKQKQLAVRSALLGKVRDGQVLVLDGLELDRPSTKTLASALRACGVNGRCLIGLDTHDRTITLSARNIPGVKVAPVAEWNALDLLNARSVVLFPGAVDRLGTTVGARRAARVDAARAETEA